MSKASQNRERREHKSERSEQSRRLCAPVLSANHNSERSEQYRRLCAPVLSVSLRFASLRFAPLRSAPLRSDLALRSARSPTFHLTALWESETDTTPLVQSSPVKPTSKDALKQGCMYMKPSFSLLLPMQSGGPSPFKLPLLTISKSLPPNAGCGTTSLLNSSSACFLLKSITSSTTSSTTGSNFRAKSIPLSSKIGR